MCKVKEGCYSAILEPSGLSTTINHTVLVSRPAGFEILKVDLHCVQGLCSHYASRHVDNSNEKVWLRRRAHRIAGLAALHRSSECVRLMILVGTGEIDETSVPTPPDPFDRTQSKRKWEMRMSTWRAAVRSTLSQYHVGRA